MPLPRVFRQVLFCLIPDQLLVAERFIRGKTVLANRQQNIGGVGDLRQRAPSHIRLRATHV